MMSNIQVTGEEGMNHICTAEDTHSGLKENMEEDKELLVYKTKFDKRFKDIGIKQVIATEMKKTLAKTNDDFVKAVLNRVEPMTCYNMRSQNLSNMLTRSNVEVYTKNVS